MDTSATGRRAHGDPVAEPVCRSGSGWVDDEPAHGSPHHSRRRREIARGNSRSLRGQARSTNLIAADRTSTDQDVAACRDDQSRPDALPAERGGTTVHSACTGAGERTVQTRKRRSSTGNRS